MSEHLLSISNLTVTVAQENHEKVLVDDIDLNIPSESIVGLVGGSGSGKTTTGLSILRLLAEGLNIKSGKLLFNGRNLLGVTEEQMQHIRGKEIGMIFQEPLNAFNPVYTIGFQIEEVLKVHTALTEDKRQNRIKELLDIVGLDDPGRIIHNYPHQLSGGMRQRAMIAQAIAANPKLIIADEPTSNLDVTLQAKIIALFKKLVDELGLSILLISHDLGMVGHMTDYISVMSEGMVVESGPSENILTDPQHQYTKKLMEAV